MQKNSTIDVWLGSKFGPWRYCQKSINLKDISQVMSNFLCLYSYHAYFILSLKSEKHVTERNKRLFEAYLLTKETSSWFLLIGSLKLTYARSYARRSGIEGLNRFSWHVLIKLTKITVTCAKWAKRTKKDEFWLAQS